MPQPGFLSKCGDSKRALARQGAKVAEGGESKVGWAMAMALDGTDDRPRHEKFQYSSVGLYAQAKAAN